mmetsp:Transcript_89352/g.193420  ORF Transcript_89352/g.193420 Transcript_89352/m.193420 type:complete len:209 (+) Transcript_89352:474-1100(+)
MTCPRRRSSRLSPRSSSPTLSPAWPDSIDFLNISTPVHVVLVGLGLMPTISTSSPTLIWPSSMRPVATVPLPAMENVSSMGIRKGLSISRLGVGMVASTASISARMASLPIFGSPSVAAASAEPLTMVMLSPSYLYRLSRSRTSISTSSSSSSSSTMSTLFRKTTRLGTPTCRASRMCSRVCGMGPSAADTTRMPPSICAAPVIIFLT